LRTPRLAALLSGGLLVAGLSVGLSGTAHASDPTVPATTWNEIFVPFDNAQGNTMCVDVPGGSTSAGVPLQFFHCHGYASNGSPQRWHFIPSFTTDSGAVAYLIQNTGSGLCVTNPVNNVNSGLRLQQGRCGSAPFWVINRQNANGTDPLMELAIFGTDLCMSAANLSDGNSTPLVATTCQPLQPTPADLSQTLELG